MVSFGTHTLFRKAIVVCTAVLVVAQLPAAKVQAYTVCDADVVPDAVVNILDYSQLAGDFFTTNPRSDVNDDGLVNILDFSILKTFFLEACVPEVTPTPSPTPTSTPTPTPTPSPTPTATPVTSEEGIWLSRAEIMALPTSGLAWDNVVNYANQSNALPNFEAEDSAFQGDDTNVIYLAKALVGVRTSNTAYLNQVQAGLQAIVDSNPDNYNFRALGLGRELGAYVIAADIIDLKTLNPALDQQFRQKLNFLRTVPVPGGPDHLVDCSNKRPNNWGGHCTASRLLVALYLDDQVEVENVVKVFKGWLGDRQAYSSFEYGTLSWQCHPSSPVGINPAQNCVVNGHNVSGAQPEERRRAQDSFAWPPELTHYDWEGLQGPFVTAELLSRHGYPDAFTWQDQALLRAVMWNFSGAENYASFNFPGDVGSGMNYPLDGDSESNDDTWMAPLINKHYGTSIPLPEVSQGRGGRPGKNIGFTDWTHR